MSTTAEPNIKPDATADKFAVLPRATIYFDNQWFVEYFDETGAKVGLFTYVHFSEATDAMHSWLVGEE